MSGHPGAMGVTTDPPAGAGAGSRELSPGLDRAARETDELCNRLRVEVTAALGR